MKHVFFALAVFGLCATATAIAPPPAAAAILCKDGFQNSGGNWISTPYCNDAELARVARKHGVRVSDAEMRANPARKYEICRFLSGSPAARDYCPGDGSSRGR
jgi:hypothetical protein